jgi:hypothetical protein
MTLRLNLPHVEPWLDKIPGSPVRIESPNPAMMARRPRDFDADFLQKIPREAHEVFKSASISLALVGQSSRLMMWDGGAWCSCELGVSALDLDGHGVGVLAEKGEPGKWWLVTSPGEVTSLCVFEDRDNAPGCIRHIEGDTFAGLYRDGRVVIFVREDASIDVLGCWRLSRTPGGVPGTSYFAELAAIPPTNLLVTEHHELPDKMYGDLIEIGVVRVLHFDGRDLFEVGVLAPDLTVTRYDAMPSVASACVGPFEGALHSERVYMQAWPPSWIALDWEPVAVRLDAFEPTDFALVSTAPAPVILSPQEPAQMTWVEHSDDVLVAYPVPGSEGLGKYTTHLLEQMRAGGEREAPDVAIAGLLARPMPRDLYALLHAWASARLEVDLGELDWWHIEPPALTEHALLLGDASWAVTLGTTAGGQPYVARVYDEHRIRILGFDDDGSIFLEARDLEHFLEHLHLGNR